MGFPRQEYWSGLPFPSPGDLPDPGITPWSSALGGKFFTTEPLGRPSFTLSSVQKKKIGKGFSISWVDEHKVDLHELISKIYRHRRYQNAKIPEMKHLNPLTWNLSLPDYLFFTTIGEDPRIQNSSMPRENIRKFFPEGKWFSFDWPTSDKKLLLHIEEVLDNQLDENLQIQRISVHISLPMQNPRP